MRAALGLGVAVLALTLAHRPAGPFAWGALAAGATALVAASAVLSHAVARLDGRASLLALDGVHQIAAAVWVGGLAHLVIYLGFERGGGHEAPRITQRFSRVAFVSVAALSLAGVGLTLGYVGDLEAFAGTAYGVMIVSKILLFVVALAFASANFGVNVYFWPVGQKPVRPAEAPAPVPAPVPAEITFHLRRGSPAEAIAVGH